MGRVSLGAASDIPFHAAQKNSNGKGEWVVQ